MSPQRRNKSRRKKNAHPQKSRPVAKARAGSPLSAEELEQLIEGGRSQHAVTRAKAAHSQEESAVSLELLVRAYLARAEALSASGMPVEAAAMLDALEQTYRVATSSIREMRRLVQARAGDLDELLAALVDEKTPPDEARAIEVLIETEVTDLEALASSSSLPGHHPLAVAATALTRAFDAVSQAGVRKEDVRLGEVSRKSPLAPWKLLVRALEAFYRNDDESCERFLQSIAPRAAPARLVATIRSMMGIDSGGIDGDEIHAVSTEIVSRVQGEDLLLGSQLERLERAFATGREKAIIAAIRKTIALCRQRQPGLERQLAQQISVRSTFTEIRVGLIRSALGKVVVRDAAFWRLYARGFEQQGQTGLACGAWELFRLHAIHEGWFGVDGVEVAALYLHMATLTSELSRERHDYEMDRLIVQFESLTGLYKDQPASALAAIADRDERDFYFFAPGKLFELAVSCDPLPETYQKWLAWERRASDWRAADLVAQAWADRCPEDARPLLDLMRSAEKRGALKKALGYLARAEALKGLSGEARIARRRILVATACSHLKQGKPHLADKDREALEALPQIQRGDWPALLNALRWGCSILRKEGGQASRWQKAVATHLESESAAKLLLWSLGSTCRFPRQDQPVLRRSPPRSERGRLVVPIGDCLTLIAHAGLETVFPTRWSEHFVDELLSAGSKTPPETLRRLAEVALEVRDKALCYVASGMGLGLAGAFRARFLLLRGKSLSPWDGERRGDCFSACVAIARQDRELELVAEVVEVAREDGVDLPFYAGMGINSMSDSMTSAQAEEVIRKESKLLDYENDMRSYDDLVEEPWGAPCDCPACRQERQGAFDHGQPDFFDELLMSDFDEDTSPDLPLSTPEDLSQKMLDLLAEAAAKFGGDGLELEEIAMVDPELGKRFEDAMVEMLQESVGALANGNAGKSRRRKGRRRR